MFRRAFLALAMLCACLAAAPAFAAGLDTLPVVTPAANDKDCGYANASPHAAQCYTAASIAALATQNTTFPAPTSTNGSIILTPGSPGPTAPPDGSIWITPSGAFARVNGVTAALGVTVPSAAAGGSNTQIQYNSSGVLAGVPGFTWNGSTLTLPGSLTLGSGVALTSPNLQGNTALMQGTATVIFAPGCGGVSGATWLIGTDAASWCSHIASGGTDNLSDGTITLNSLTTGFGNLAFGSEVLHLLTTGSNNACFGFEACHADVTGGNNDAVGFDALASEQSGSNNVAMGQGALPVQNGGSSNVAIGPSAGPVVTTGANETLVGAGAGVTVTSGNKNIMVGVNSGFGIATGHGNVWIGGQGTTLSDQNDSVTLADGDGTIHYQFLAANAFATLKKPIQEPSFASSSALSGGGFTLGSATIVGTGAAVACATSHVCDSISGEVTLTTGTSISANGLALTIGFALTRSNQPACLVTNFRAATDVASSYSDAFTNQLTINSKANLVASTAYTVDYVCGGN